MPDDPLFLIWSNQQGMWWRPSERGYTPILEEAGRYGRDDAHRLVAKATCNWQLRHEQVDPMTGEAYVCFDEAIVLAPESTEVA